MTMNSPMNWIRKALKGISLTAAMFVFQACYGTMNDYYDAKVTFHVVDEDGDPLEGVGIYAQELNPGDSSALNDYQDLVEYTDSNGLASWWTYGSLQRLTFADKDSLYAPVEAIVRTDEADTINVVLEKIK